MASVLRLLATMSSSWTFTTGKYNLQAATPIMGIGLPLSLTSCLPSHLVRSSVYWVSLFHVHLLIKRTDAPVSGINLILAPFTDPTMWCVMAGFIANNIGSLICLDTSKNHMIIVHCHGSLDNSPLPLDSSRWVLSVSLTVRSIPLSKVSLLATPLTFYWASRSIGGWVTLLSMIPCSITIVNSLLQLFQSRI